MSWFPPRNDLKSIIDYCGEDENTNKSDNDYPPRDDFRCTNEDFVDEGTNNEDNDFPLSDKLVSDEDNHFPVEFGDDIFNEGDGIPHCN